MTDPAKVLRFVIAVRQNAANIEALAVAISTPGSPSYGAFYEAARMEKFKSAEATAAVSAWLGEFDLVNQKTSPHGEFIEVQVLSTPRFEPLLRLLQSSLCFFYDELTASGDTGNSRDSQRHAQHNVPSVEHREHYHQSDAEILASR